MKHELFKTVCMKKWMIVLLAMIIVLPLSSDLYAASKKKKKKGPSLYEKMLGMQAEQQGQQGADSNIKKSANLKSTQNIEYSGNSKGGIASKANALNKNKGGK